MTEINIGDEITITYPFVLEDFTFFDEDGGHTMKSWRPGTRMEAYGPEDCEAVGDGIGSQTMKVVGIYKAGKYPTRVFFTRTWTSPTGKTFGKSKLLIMTRDAFRRRCRGFMHEYRIAKPSEIAA